MCQFFFSRQNGTYNETSLKYVVKFCCLVMQWNQFFSQISSLSHGVLQVWVSSTQVFTLILDRSRSKNALWVKCFGKLQERKGIQMKLIYVATTHFEEYCEFRIYGLEWRPKNLWFTHTDFGKNWYN